MKNDAKSEGKLICRFKIGVTNLTNFDLKFKRLKNLHFNGLLLNKVHMLELKNYRGAMYDGTEV